MQRHNHDKRISPIEKFQEILKFTPFLAVTLLAGIEAQADRQITITTHGRRSATTR